MLIEWLKDYTGIARVDICCFSENSRTLHPDHICNVPSTTYKVIK